MPSTTDLLPNVDHATYRTCATGQQSLNVHEPSIPLGKLDPADVVAELRV
ncbi:hypothetical protein [Actinomadura roseirufa]|nr:hypothetical protein [Actinomadura roseirufa]